MFNNLKIYLLSKINSFYKKLTNLSYLVKNMNRFIGNLKLIENINFKFIILILYDISFKIYFKFTLIILIKILNKLIFNF